MLEKLTPEQEALFPVIVDEYMQLLQPPGEFDRVAVNTWLERVYGFYKLPLPNYIDHCLSPQAALKRASELLGEKQTSLDWMGVSDAGWVSFYDYWHRIGVLTDDEAKEVLELKAFMQHVWDTVLLDEHAIICLRPIEICTDSDGNLHNAEGPCIRWRDGQKDYAWHGVWVPEKVILEPTTITKEEYASFNTETRRALGERAGWSYVVGLLGAKVVDTWTDPKTELSNALFSAEGQNWLRKQSPVLQNGAQPFYFEPVHEELRTAKAARKWQATDNSPQDCEKDPELVYGQET